MHVKTSMTKRNKSNNFPIFGFRIMDGEIFCSTKLAHN